MEGVLFLWRDEIMFNEKISLKHSNQKCGSVHQQCMEMKLNM